MPWSAPVGVGSGVYKSKPARIKDKLRMTVVMPSGGKSINGDVPYKKKPPRKGRPDGA